MTSQTSLTKLMIDDFKHRRWMFILSLVVQIVLGPLTVLFSVSTIQNEYFYDDMPRTAEELKNVMLGAVSSGLGIDYKLFGTIIVFVGAIIVSVVGFRHLYSKRCMDLYGSVPISRNKQFLVVYLNGLLIYAIPLVCCSLLNLAIVAVAVGKYGQFGEYALTILIDTALLLVGFLAVYHTCLVAVMISGNAFAAIVNSIIIGIVVVSAYSAVIWLMDNCYTTFYSGNGSAILGCAWLSPFTVPVVLAINELYTLDIFPVYIVLSAALILMSFFAAIGLHKFRKAELAENGVKNRIYIFIVRIAVSFISGFYCIEFFHFFIGTENFIWDIIVMIIGCVASYGIANIIMYKSGKAFFKDYIALIVVTVFTAGIFSFIEKNDGYDKYIPAESNIKSASVYFYGLTGDGIDLIVEDGKVVGTKGYSTPEENLDKTILTNASQIHDLLEAGVNSLNVDSTYTYVSNDELSYCTSALVKVTLKSGLSYYREYDIRLGQIDKIRAIVEDENYIKTMYPLESGQLPYPDILTFTKYDNSQYGYSEISITDKAIIKEILDAYYVEFVENYSVEQHMEGYSSAIEATYELPGYGFFGEKNNTYDYLEVRENFIRTNALIDKYFNTVK